MIGFDAGTVQLETSCSKGTYIRVLAEDIARALGTCGHVSLLRRLHVEPFEGEPMVTLEAVTAAAEAGEPAPLVRADRGVPQLPEVRLTAAGAARVSHGQAAQVPAETPPGRVRLYDDRRPVFRHRRGGWLRVGAAPAAVRAHSEALNRRAAKSGPKAPSQPPGD